MELAIAQQLDLIDASITDLSDRYAIILGSYDSADPRKRKYSQIFCHRLDELQAKARSLTTITGDQANMNRCKSILDTVGWIVSKQTLATGPR